MFKAMTFYALEDGVDPEEFWKYHTEIHAADVRNAIGPDLLKKQHKYAINRVTKTVRGKPEFFGIVEMWWDDEESNEESLRRGSNYITASGKNIQDDFVLHGAKSLYAVHLEEKEIT